MESVEIQGFHAHVYFEPTQRDSVLELRAKMQEANLGVEFGRVHEKPVGPHPTPMFTVVVPLAAFAEAVKWLMLNRGSHSVLVHPETGDDLRDHRDLPIWMGEPLALNFDALQ